MFEQVDMSAAVVGKVNDSRKLVLRQGNESATLFDFTSDKITGCDPSKVPLSGSLRQKVSKSVKKRC